MPKALAYEDFVARNSGYISPETQGKIREDTTVDCRLWDWQQCGDMRCANGVREFYPCRWGCGRRV